MLKKYPTLVETLMEHFDDKITFVDPNRPRSTADTRMVLDFSCLFPSNPASPATPSVRKESKVVNNVENTSAKKNEENNTKKSEETDLLMQVVEAGPKVYKTVLRHPLVKSFLHLKWERFRIFTFISIFFYVRSNQILSIFVLYM
jgi:hypothetical protein